MCFLCSSIQGSSLVSAHWHSVSLANSWTSDKTKSREQRSLVLPLLPVAITSPGLVLLTKSFSLKQWAPNSWHTYLHLHTRRYTHTHTHTVKTQALQMRISLKPLHPDPPPTSFSLLLCHCPNLILPRLSVSSVSDINLKNKTLTLVSVFLAVFTLLQPSPQCVLWWHWFTWLYMVTGKSSLMVRSCWFLLVKCNLGYKTLSCFGFFCTTICPLHEKKLLTQKNVLCVWFYCSLTTKDEYRFNHFNSITPLDLAELLRSNVINWFAAISNH